MKDSIITYKSPKDPISEAFRNMRTNITFADIDEELRVLTITSTGKVKGSRQLLRIMLLHLPSQKRKCS